MHIVWVSMCFPKNKQNKPSNMHRVGCAYFDPFSTQSKSTICNQVGAQYANKSPPSLATPSGHHDVPFRAELNLKSHARIYTPHV